MCEHLSSKYRKMATEILHENNGYEKSYENEVNENYSITSKTGTTRTSTSRPQSTTPMTTLTSTDAWRTYTESALIAHLSTAVIISHFTFHGSSPELFHITIHGHQHGAFSLIRLLPFLLPFLPALLRLPLPPRAVP